MISVRCDVVTKEEIQYILFYDIDYGTLSQEDIKFIDGFCTLRHLSYILYKTKHGYHLVTLTPTNARSWGNNQEILKEHFHSYYGGIVIRLSRKKEEQQELISSIFTNGEVIPILHILYTKRFNLKPMRWI